MSSHRGKRIVLLGLMSRKPVAGVIWQTLHYLLGFQRLGYEVYYVEAHGGAPVMLMQHKEDDGSERAASFIADVMHRFGLDDRWAFHALHADGRCYGLSENQLKQLYRSAALIINLHGGTKPLEEHSATDRLVYLETDPVAMQIELHQNVQQAIDFLEPHCAFFTFGENYGNPDCKLPTSERFDFRPTRQPIITDLWRPYSNGAGDTYTTIGSWQQLGREVAFKGEVYHWSKHYEFLKFIDLPARTNQGFELALNRYGEPDKRLLEDKGWRVRDALSFSTDLDSYRRYIVSSRGEFTVAKDQNLRLRSGWFSDRSATYLAAGRPVITQETGFSGILPVGQGLFAFSEMDEIVQAVESINSDYGRHCHAAYALAREYFEYDVVLTPLLEYLGLSHPAGRSRVETKARIAEGATGEQESTSADEDLADARRPTPPAEAHRATLTSAPGTRANAQQSPLCSVIIPVYNHASLTRKCLHALVEGCSESTDFEIIVVDDASTDTTRQLLAGYREQVRVVTHTTNTGFAAACNDGAAAASGEYLVFLNNDMIPGADWLDALVRYAETHPGVAIVGSKLLFPNDTIQHAGVVVCQDLHPRHLYAGFPAKHPAVNKSRRFQIVSAACMLVRREPFEQVGGFDPAFRNGFEDVDFCLRLGERGYEIHYCHESILYHLESVSEGRFGNEKDNLRLYLTRWAYRLQPDDLHYYLEDGLINVSYAQSYPAYLTVSPLLATVDGEKHKRQADRLLNVRSQQVFELLKETIRLTLSLGEAELRAPAEEQAELRHRLRELAEKKEAEQYKGSVSSPAVGERTELLEGLGAQTETSPGHDEAELRAMLLEAHAQLLQRDRELESIMCDLQTVLAAELRRQSVPGTRVPAPVIDQGFVPSEYLSYQRLIRRVREVVVATLPPKATVAVVSKGDEELLELGDDRQGWHFPRDEQGVYAGYYPADGAEAIAHLEELRAKGAEFLLFPETSFWWLERYGEFAQHLKSRYRVTLQQEDACMIFALREPETERCDTVAQGSCASNLDGKDNPA